MVKTTYLPGSICQRNIFSQINSLILQTWERPSRMEKNIRMAVKHRDTGISQNAWVGNLVLPFSSYLILVPQLPHLQNGDNKKYYPICSCKDSTQLNDYMKGLSIKRYCVKCLLWLSWLVSSHLCKLPLSTQSLP